MNVPPAGDNVDNGSMPPPVRELPQGPTSKRAGGWMSYIVLFLIGIVNAAVSGWLVFYIPLGFAILSPLILSFDLFFLLETIFLVLVGRAFIKHFWPSSFLLRRGALFTIILFFVIQFVAGFSLGAQLIFSQISNSETQNTNSEQSAVVTMSSSSPVALDTRGLELDGIHAEGDQLVWASHGAMPYDNVFLFVPNFSASTGTVMKISDLSKSQSHTIWDDKILNNQIYWIDDANLYRYDTQLQKPVLVTEGVGKIYGFDPQSNNLILAKGALVVDPSVGTHDYYYNVVQSDSNPDLLYNLSSGATETLSLPPEVSRDSSSLISRGPDLCYKAGENEIGMYNIDSGTNDTFTITPKEVYVPQAPYYGGVDLVDCNAQYIAYSYMPKNPAPGTYSYPVIGIFDVSQKKSVFERDFTDNDTTTNTTAIVGKFYGNNFYYSQALPVGGNITVRDILLPTMQDNKLISISNFTGCGFGYGWDVGDGFVAYTQYHSGQVPGGGGGSCSSDLYIQKLGD